MTARITRLNPETLFPAQDFGYSQISITGPGRTAYVSGQAAIQPDGSLPSLDLGEQTDLALANIAAALAALEADTGQIVQLRCMVTGLDTAAMAVVLPRIQAFLGGVEPSLVVLGVEFLAAPELRVAFEMTVHLPD